MEEKDPVLHDSTDPLSPMAKRALLAAVIFFHVGGGWALTLIHPDRLIVGEANPMEVSFVAPDAPPAPESPPEETPPEPPQLESMIQPPPPDLPPPDFPVPPPPPPKPAVKPPPPKPQQHANPNPAAPPTAAPPAPQQAGPKVVGENQVSWINRPNVIYPAKSRRNGEQGRAMLKVLIEPSGRPGQVLLEKSSGHPALDDAAISGVKAARLRPYVENGVPQPIWVLVPINFVLQ